MSKPTKSKLKNKKKDVISLSNDDPSPSTKDTPSLPPEETLPEKFFLDINKTTTHLTDKILWEIELLLALSDSIDLKLNNCLLPLMSKQHLQDILEERESRNICGNFQCPKSITNKSKKALSYNIIKKKFTEVDPQDYFCSIECFNVFKKITVSSIEKFDYFKLLTLDTVFLLANIKNYYPENDHLDRIADLSEQIINDYLNHNKQIKSKLGNYFKRQRLRISKMFIDDFDELIKDSEFTSNEETKEIFHNLFDINYNTIS